MFNADFGERLTMRNDAWHQGKGILEPGFVPDLKQNCQKPGQQSCGPATWVQGFGPLTSSGFKDYLPKYGVLVTRVATPQFSLYAQRLGIPHSDTFLNKLIMYLCIYLKHLFKAKGARCRGGR